MDKHQHQIISRETLLMLLFNKITKEYKALLEYTRRQKPFKIIEIIELSNVPGESLFAIQLTNKNIICRLTASKIIKDYNLNDFNDFHAEMVRQAARGKLIEFLKLSEKVPLYRISEKKFDKTNQQYCFYIETNDQIRFMRTTTELSKDKNILFNMDVNDVYDIGYTQGYESIVKEKMALLLAKSK